MIAGVQFDIYSVDDKGNAADLVASMTTDENGIAESSDLFPADYIVKEHVNPAGYVDELWSDKITVGMDEVVTRTVTNMPIQGMIRIIKTDSETGKGLARRGVYRNSYFRLALPQRRERRRGRRRDYLRTRTVRLLTPLLTWGEYQIVEIGRAG